MIYQINVRAGETIEYSTHTRRHGGAVLIDKIGGTMKARHITDMNRIY